MTEIIKSADIITRLNGIIWGEAKVGKTTWAMTLPGRKLLINFDPDGFASVLSRDDFDVIDLSNLPASEAIKEAKKVGTFILEHKDKYQSVIFDSLTTLMDVSLEDAINRGIGKSAVFTPTLDAPGLTGYGARNNGVKDVVNRIMRATSQAGLHLFLIAHMDDPQMDKKGENIIQHTIMLSAKVRNSIGIRVSEIYLLETGSSGKRNVYLAPIGFKKPMGSRMFNTEKVKKFVLLYDADKPDEGQSTTLAAIFKKWNDGGLKRMITTP